MKIINIIDRLNERTGTAVSWLSGAMVLIVCYDVFTRYVLNKSSVAVQELEWHLFAVIFLMGAACTFKDNRHVRIDIFYLRLSEKGRAAVDLVGTVFFLIPFCLVVIWTSIDFFLNSLSVGESSPDPGGLPARYIIKACIPVSFLLIMLQGVSVALKSFYKLTGKYSDIQEGNIG